MQTEPTLDDLAKQSSSPIAPFRVEPIALGLPPGLSYDNVQEVLDHLEREDQLWMFKPDYCSAGSDIK